MRSAKNLVRLVALPKRNFIRKQSTAGQLNNANPVQQRAFWTSGRVFLLTAFTGSLTYLYGFSDAKASLQKPTVKAPQAAYNYGSKKDMEKAIEELRQILGEDTVSTDDEDLRTHGYSEWSSINIDQLPVAVAYPKSTEDVSKIAIVCHKYRVPMSECIT